MNKLINDLDELINIKEENHELKQELSNLVKMLKSGFEKKTIGMEKIPKLFASNDEKKIAKFYDTLANNINALKISGSFELFQNYININYGIKIDFAHDNSPSNHYVTKPKKLNKFKDLYSTYFLEDIPKDANVAIKKIMSSLDSLTKENVTMNDNIKEILNSIIEQENNHTPSTIKTLDKILTSARIKNMKASEVASDIEDKLNLQLQAVDIIKGESNEETI